jgi:hypothetical protein
MSSTRNIGIVMHPSGNCVSRWTQLPNSIPVGQTYSFACSSAVAYFEVEHIHIDGDFDARVMCFVPLESEAYDSIAYGSDRWTPSNDLRPGDGFCEPITRAFDCWAKIREKRQDEQEEMEILLRHAKGLLPQPGL